MLVHLPTQLSLERVSEGPQTVSYTLTPAGQYGIEIIALLSLDYTYEQLAPKFKLRTRGQFLDTTPPHRWSKQGGNLMKKISV